MVALLTALLLVAAEPPVKTDAPAPVVAADPGKPADISNAVDANGVPAWAKRKRLYPVQNCSSRPNIAVGTWRDETVKDGKGNRPRSTPIRTTCK